MFRIVALEIETCLYDMSCTQGAVLPFGREGQEHPAWFQRGLVPAGRGRGLRERTAQDPPQVQSKDPASDSPGGVGRGGRYTRILTKQITTKAVAAVMRAAIEVYSHGLADLSSSMETLYHRWRSVPSYSVPGKATERAFVFSSPIDRAAPEVLQFEEACGTFRVAMVEPRSCRDGLKVRVAALNKHQRPVLRLYATVASPR